MSDAPQKVLTQQMCSEAFHVTALVMYASIFGCRANWFISGSLKITSATAMFEEAALLQL